MKTIIALAMILVCTVSCQKENVGIAEGQCFPVSIAADICGQAALKIEDPKYFHLGESWLEHQNVFYTDFGCRDISGLRENTFYVVIVSEPQGLDGCARCAAALAYEGEKRYHVKLVDACE